MEYGDKKKFALNRIIHIFDKFMESDDRIAFIRFNSNVNVVFDLTEVGKNRKHL